MNVRILCCLWFALGSSSSSTVSSHGCLPPVQPYGGIYSPIKSKYLLNEEIDYSCFHDFYQFGEEKRKCSEDGKWNGTASFCVKNLPDVYVDQVKVGMHGMVKNCTSVKTTFAVSFNYTGNYKSAIFRLHVFGSKPGELQMFTKNNDCEFNFTLISDESFVANCLLSLNNVPKKANTQIIVAHLSKNIQICKVQIFPLLDFSDFHCPLLEIKDEIVAITYEPPIENGIVTYGTAAFFHCNNSSILRGEAIVYCGENTWIGNNSYCENIECASLPPVLNGHMNYTNKTIHGIAQLQCDEDYEISNQKFSICLSNNSWSYTDFQCYRNSKKNYSENITFGILIAVIILVSLGLIRVIYSFIILKIRKKNSEELVEEHYYHQYGSRSTPETVVNLYNTEIYEEIAENPHENSRHSFLETENSVNNTKTSDKTGENIYSEPEDIGKM